MSVSSHLQINLLKELKMEIFKPTNFKYWKKSDIFMSEFQK